MNDAHAGLRSASHDDGEPVAMSRTVRGGIKRITTTSCEVHHDGRYVCARIGADDVSGTMTTEQFALFEAVCNATDFASLPHFVDVPVTRSDSYLWTYRIGEHEVKVRDPDRAGEAVPAALRTLDALVTALEGGFEAAAPPEDPPPPRAIGDRLDDDRLTNVVWDAPSGWERDR